MYTKDTIAAIATGMTGAGIGIIRISGPEAIDVADRIFCAQNKQRIEDLAGYQALFGEIKDGAETVDEVVVLLMRGPHSYTTEDVVELQCHGGQVVLRRILNLVFQHGARPAQPGEFTKRAFLGGRIDLAQAESVMDLIQAKNALAARASVTQLKGRLSEEIRRLRKLLLHELAYIESALDDPEHYSLEGYTEKLRGILEEVEESVDKLLATVSDGQIIREGLRTVILGKPNVGKSSVLNQLLGNERAIVTDIPGTTRDTLEEDVHIQGIPLRIVDTAGIHDSVDFVEKIGIEKAKESIGDADLILHIIDATTGISEEDRDIMKLLESKKRITLINKTDVDDCVDRGLILGEIKGPYVEVSAKTGDGFDAFYQLLQSMFHNGTLELDDEICITDLRHAQLLREARESLSKVEEGMEAGMPEDFLTIDLTDAYERLGAIIGEELGDDLAEEIFSKFCMGK